MPQKPPRPCWVQSCPKLVTGSIAYCDDHIHLAPTGWIAKKDHDHQKFYSTRPWIRASKAYRQQHPLCQQCQVKGIITPADVADHIQPIQAGGDRFDWNNLQSLCHSCHNSKTAKENANR